MTCSLGLSVHLCYTAQQSPSVGSSIGRRQRGCRKSNYGICSGEQSKNSKTQSLARKHTFEARRYDVAFHSPAKHFLKCTHFYNTQRLQKMRSDNKAHLMNFCRFSCHWIFFLHYLKNRKSNLCICTLLPGTVRDNESIIFIHAYLMKSCSKQWCKSHITIIFTKMSY